MTALAGTTDGLWDVGRGQRLHFEGREVRSLRVGPSGCFAIIDGREIWRSSGIGDWERSAAVEVSKALCLLPTENGLLIGTSDATLLSLRGETLEPLPSFDTVEGREDWYTPWGGPPDVRSMATDPAGTIYVNVHVGGIVRSTDLGESWLPTIDIDADVHEVFYDATSSLLLAASAAGLAISADGGASWRFHTEGLHGTYARAVAVAGDFVLLSASTGPSTRQGAIYRRRLNGDDAFERCRRGLPEWFSENINTFCLSAMGPRAVLGTADGRAFLSSDQGQSWHPAAEGLPGVRCVAFAESE